MNDNVLGQWQTTIFLHSGKTFNFLDPEASAFTIDDIAHGLSMICRFGGHCDPFYSVAEHSVHISYALPDEHALAGLLHDGPEFVTGDVVRPLKGLLPDYRVHESRIEKSVLSRFWLKLPLPDIVKQFDLRMLKTEYEQLMRGSRHLDFLKDVEALPIELPCWDPRTAKQKFLERFYELYYPEKA